MLSSLHRRRKITVSLKETQQNSVEIKIRDTGIGIAQEEIPKLFDRFYQVDNSHTRDYEGTGIGLALTKELVSYTMEVLKSSEKAMTEIGRFPTWQRSFERR
jgi:signal transduction histidine kinase